MTPRPHEEPPPALEVLYDSPRASAPQRVVVSLGTGLALAAFVIFVRWGFYAAPAAGSALPAAALGGAVSAVMLVAAMRARTVRRVEAGGGRLRLHRDPAAVEEHPLDGVTDVASEPVVGGWSRDPAERLVLTLKDGTTRRYDLPDDADTPGIVGDLKKLLA